ncbi:hypothetical protein HOD96_01500 [Candidatus Falkowbacteria bacterium]|jgi:hypothetical protein|nr:hypothetical protein [Candidatus Falkowbacteria bacterium]MBT4433409.1 hypothetical protein [Candidatus Falkowbacteria bacterium]
MLETSKDVLYIILAFCVLWLTIFLSWLMFYIIKIFRNTNKIINQATETISKVDRFVDAFKGKLESSTSNLMLLADLARQGMEFVGKKRGGKRNTKGKK